MTRHLRAFLADVLLGRPCPYCQTRVQGCHRYVCAARVTVPRVEGS